MWVVTPQKAYAESTMYQLEVIALSLYKVVVDIIDYNPLTDIERVCKPAALVLVDYVKLQPLCNCSNRGPHFRNFLGKS